MKYALRLTGQRARYSTSRRRFIVAGAALGSVSVVRAPAKAAQFEFRCASDLVVDHPSSIRMTQMWAAVEQESGGRIHTQFFPNGSLGNAQGTLSQLRIGAIQFFIGLGTVPTIVPAANLPFLGFAFRDLDEAWHAMDRGISGYIHDDAVTKGLFTLRSMWDSGMFVLSSSSHAIRNPDDMKGFKCRVAENPIAVDLFRALGASPVPLAATEAYTALETKTVDGQTSPLPTIEASRFYEVQKFISLTNHAWSGLLVIANANVWNGLPQDLQELLQRINTRYALLERQDSKMLAASTSAKLRSQGMAVNSVEQAPFRARLRPYYDAWAANFGPTVWGLLQNAIGRKI
jgi:TRAP-type transport system periplasmic protein